MPHNWVNKINQNNSRLYKEKIIKQCLMASMIGAEDAKLFLRCVWHAYNPYLRYNIKQVPTTNNGINRDNPYHKFFELLQNLNSRTITGNTAKIDVEQISYMFDSDIWNLLLAPTILKDLRIGATVTTFNKFLKKTKYEIPVFECQKAGNTKGCLDGLSGKKLLEPKFDGVRALAMINTIPKPSITIYSSSGIPFSNFLEIENQILNNLSLFVNNTQWQEANMTSFVLDGEIISKTFQDLMKQTHRKFNVDISDATFQIFDVIHATAFEHGQWNVSQKIRSFNFLGKIANQINEQLPNVKIIQGITVDLDNSDGKSIMERYAQDMIAENYEGIMIKDLSVPYKCSRSSNWLKWKPTITVDLEIIDFKEGSGKNVGNLGSLICAGYDNDIFIKTKVGGGLSDENRKAIWNNQEFYKGYIVEIEADRITQNQNGSYSLRFPRFVRFRGLEKGEKF